jgi:charged multivesicular body protein 2A
MSTFLLGTMDDAGHPSQAMAKMNKVFNLPELNKIMAEFQKEEMKAEMTMEMMGDTMDDVMEGENDEVEEQQIVAQILDEIGITLNGALAEAPTGKPQHGQALQQAEEAAPPAASQPVGVGVGGGSASPPGGVDPAVSELEERLNNLRRN